MEYSPGIQFPEGHETFCKCDLCEATELAIAEHYRVARRVRIQKEEAEEIEQAMILDHLERNG